ncbi:MAG: hypothetical protein D4R80_00995 [Deltaproteobacteria bacterium]|nr:MAG: hypothetical protein D4R80_00995 [Deltaproteobacteria bacterium]
MKILDDTFDRVEIGAARTLGEADYFLRMKGASATSRIDFPPAGIVAKVKWAARKVLLMERTL